MKRKFKFTSLVSLVLVGLFVLSSCGTAGNKPGTTGENGQAGSDESGKPAEVLLWNMQFEDWYGDHFNQMMEQFNSENKDVHVTQQFINGSVWDQKMKAAQAAKTAPDTYVLAYNQVPFSAAQGLIRNMDDLIPQSAWDDIYDNVKPMITYQGKYYAYPIFTELQTLLYYRKDMFQEAGLDPDTPPRTWDDLIADAKKLTKDDVFGVNFPGFSGDFNWAAWGWEYQAANHLALTDDWKSANITDQGFVDLADFVRTLYDEKVVPAQQLANYNDPKPFLDGRLAMMFNGSWVIAALKKDNPELADKVGVAPAPTKDGNQKVTTSAAGGFTYVLDAKSTKAEEAAKYIHWLLADDPSVPAQYFKTAAYSKYAVRKSVDEYITEHDKDAYNDKWRNDITEQVLPYAKPEAVYATEINQYVSNAFQSIVLDHTPAEEALSKAAKQINDYITTNDYSSKKP